MENDDEDNGGGRYWKFWSFMAEDEFFRGKKDFFFVTS
jgi:hypothetical protein